MLKYDAQTTEILNQSKKEKVHAPKSRTRIFDKVITNTDYLLKCERKGNRILCNQDKHNYAQVTTLPNS